jgi:hypothetical protein
LFFLHPKKGVVNILEEEKEKTSGVGRAFGYF